MKTITPTLITMLRTSPIRTFPERSIQGCYMLLIAVLFGVPVLTYGFSGEDPLAESRSGTWHHEQITRRAAEAVGFAPHAAATLAWHADYIDSYLYNPLWWAQGNIPDRYKVSMATYEELAKLHLDDLFSTDAVRHSWNRYLFGTLAGLIWAQEHYDVSAAKNIVGVSLHAIQDLYAHSNWVDPIERRSRTWFEFNPRERGRMDLWTGSYEIPDNLGRKPHGKIAPACSILNQSGVSGMMDILCHPISPLSNTSICEQWRLCQDSSSITPVVLSVPIPSGVVYVAPPGINLDNTWMAEVGVVERGIEDVTALEIFNIAKELALRSSIQWLSLLELRMKQLGPDFERFWNLVKTESNSSTREQEYEQYHRFPYQFLTVGPYPPEQGATGDEYYLRVQIQTDTVSDAGTNSNILLHVGEPSFQGSAFRLDYLHQDVFPPLRYDDFQGGDNAVYYVGPFPSLPTSITLENESADLGDVIETLFIEAGVLLGKLLDSIGDFLLSFFLAGHAENIKNEHFVFGPEFLSNVGYNYQPFPPIELNGGGEGHYRVHGFIKKERTGYRSAMIQYRVRLDELECVKESKWDRGSNSDEPFLLALLIPLPGARSQDRIQDHLAGPYSDVDDNERRTIGHEFLPVRVPNHYGALSLSLSLWEHDDESQSTRREMLDQLANRAEEGTASQRDGLITTIGRAIGEDWKPSHIEVYAFSRGATVRTGTVLDQNVDRWIRGGERMSFQLQTQNMTDWGIQARDLEAFRLVAQHVRFDSGFVGFRSTEPDQYGEIRNDGAVSVSIIGASKSGPHSEEFDILFEHDSQTFRLSEFPDGVELSPGEVLIVKGSFLPQAEGLRTVRVDVGTDALHTPNVRISMSGHAALPPEIASVSLRNYYPDRREDPDGDLYAPDRNGRILSGEELDIKVQLDSDDMPLPSDVYISVCPESEIGTSDTHRHSANCVSDHRPAAKGRSEYRFFSLTIPEVSSDTRYVVIARYLNSTLRQDITILSARVKNLSIDPPIVKLTVEENPILTGLIELTSPAGPDGETIHIKDYDNLAGDDAIDIKSGSSNGTFEIKIPIQGIPMRDIFSAGLYGTVKVQSEIDLSRQDSRWRIRKAEVYLVHPHKNILPLDLFDERIVAFAEEIRDGIEHISLLMMGEKPNELWTINPVDRYGFDKSTTSGEVVSTGDINSDGFPDIAVAFPNGAIQGHFAVADRKTTGVVFILCGLTGEDLGSFAGETPNGRFGEAVARIGKKELAIGAPGTDQTSGSVYIVNLDSLRYERIIKGEKPGDEFGAEITALEDDAKGYMAIGSPNADGEEPGAGVVYYASSSGPLEQLSKGQAAGDRFGQAIIRVPGIGLLVSAPNASRSAMGQGEITLIDFKGKTQWIMTGREAEEEFGTSIALIEADSESDYEFDILIGAPGASSYGPDSQPIKKSGGVYMLTSKGELKRFIGGGKQDAHFGKDIKVGPPLLQYKNRSIYIMDPEISDNMIFTPSSAVSPGIMSENGDVIR